MPSPLRTVALLMAFATLALADDSEATILFDKARAKILNSARKVPRYTCEQEISRVQYDERHKTIWHDRLRVDVALIEGAEMFGWVNGKLEARTINDLVDNTGAAGSGDFVSFLIGVFGNEPEWVRFFGYENGLGHYQFSVPRSRTRYRFASKSGPEKLAYSGSFFLDPVKAELTKLTIDTEDFPPAEQTRGAHHVMEYRTVKIGAGEFILPKTTTLTVNYKIGEESVNQTTYSNCREYVGESTIRFDDAEIKADVTAEPVKPLAPKQVVTIGLTSPIDFATAAAGDPLTGVLLDGLRNKAGKRGDVVHGHILRLIQFLQPTPVWMMAIRFDTLDRTGATVPLSLEQAKDHNKTNPVHEYVFPERGAPKLDRGFHTMWVTK
jgi:hypothetical protein